MAKKTTHSNATLWARFRFSVVGPLLSAPPPRGELKAALQSLAEKVWSHPITGQDVRFAQNTIERWYYRARNERDDPVCVLRNAVRKDTGNVSVRGKLAEQLRKQYRDYSHWSYQLHYDNLVSAVQADASLGPACSYSTARRFMQANGMRRRRRRPKRRPGEARAVRRRETREVRSYESEYVGSLWHLDFHHGSLKILSEDGQWLRPIALGILDDRARLVCHLQWYLSETTEDLVHGFSQAIQKRGLPRALMTDNGPAMVAEEFMEGLQVLGILHEKTLPYSPHQNGKQERLWATLEGRLMEMLEGVEVNLEFLNRATQAWVEMDYNRTPHRELSQSPIDRFSKSPDVLRPSPSSEALRDAFRLQTTRRQRQTDGTLSLGGVRFEIPAQLRHFRELTVCYARWDLSRVDVVDPRDGTNLARIYPLDRVANADGRRSAINPDVGHDEGPEDGPSAASCPDDGGPDKPLPPLLRQILDEYSASGVPPAYLPKQSDAKKGKHA